MDTLDSSLYLSNDDIYLLGNGNWFRSYEKLGAHPAKAADGTPGYHFAVWAPHVQSVHVIGDFNDWDEAASPLTKSKTGDVWEGFIPGVVAGQLYKFLLVSHDAELVRAAATAVLMVGRQTRLAASVEEGVEAIIEGAL